MDVTYLSNAFDVIEDIAIKKSTDYTTTSPFENFEKVALATGLQVEDIFHVFIATKLNRIRNLVDNGKPPENESISDSILDLATYAVLYLAWNQKRMGASK